MKVCSPVCVCLTKFLRSKPCGVCARQKLSVGKPVVFLSLLSVRCQARDYGDCQPYSFVCFITAFDQSETQGSCSVMNKHNVSARKPQGILLIACVSPPSTRSACCQKTTALLCFRLRDNKDFGNFRNAKKVTAVRAINGVSPNS